MTPRTQAMIVALAVLLIGMGVILVGVGELGVQSSVFSADNTPTAVSPAPVSTDGWTPIEDQPGAWEYLENGESLAQIQQSERTLDTLTGGQPLPDGTTIPALVILDQMRASDEAQFGPLDNNPLVTFDGPQVQLVNGVPVALVHITYAAGIYGEEAVDAAVVLIDQGSDNYNLIQFIKPGERDARLYDGFMAWLADNIADLAQSETATEADTDSDADTNTDTNSDADTGSETDADTNSDADTGSETDTSTDADTDTGSDTDTSTDASTDAATDTDAGTDASTGTSSDPASSDTVETQTWVELAPGQIYYTANLTANATIVHGTGSQDTILTNLGIDPASEDAPATLEEMLNLLKADIETSMEEQGLVVGTDAVVEGPTFTQVGDVQLAALSITVEATTDATGQAQPRQYLAQYLIDQGDRALYYIQFSYMGESDPVLDMDFQTWLNENVPVLVASAESEE